MADLKSENFWRAVVMFELGFFCVTTLKEIWNQSVFFKTSTPPPPNYFDHSHDEYHDYVSCRCEVFCCPFYLL